MNHLSRISLVVIMFSGGAWAGPVEAFRDISWESFKTQPPAVAVAPAPVLIQEEDALARKISLHVRNAPLDKAMAIIVGQTDIGIFIPAAIRDTAKRVTADISGQSAREVLSVVLGAQGLTYSKKGGGGRYFVIMRDALALVVNIEVRDTALSDFLDRIAALTRTRFIIDDSVEPRPVTARFFNVSARDAVVMAAGSQGLAVHYAEDGQTYFIRPK